MLPVTATLPEKVLSPATDCAAASVETNAS